MIGEKYRVISDKLKIFRAIVFTRADIFLLLVYFEEEDTF